MLIIGLIGSKATGKETVAKYIHKKYGGAYYAHSEILDQILDILKLPKSRENEIKLVSLRKMFGPQVLPNALNKKIRSDNADVVVVTGIRFQSEFENIRSYENNKILYIDAPLETRYKWQLSRKEKEDDADISFVQFVNLEKYSETEANIKELGQKADFYIENTGSLEELYEKVDNIIEQIIKK